MDLVTPAPSVDATDDDARDSRSGRSDRDRGTDREHRPAPVEELFSPDGPDRLAFDAEMDRVVDELYRRIERRMRIERERRGL